MNVEIADRLAKRRREAGLSQEELAMRLGVSRQAVSKWERSESSPDTNNLIALAKLYEVSLDALLYVDDSIENDVEFEIADRALKDSEQSFADDSAQDASRATIEEEDASSTNNEDGCNKGTAHTNINQDGIQFGDGDEYVNISWRDGINVVDKRKGEYVHVGWDGIHVVEGGLDGTEVTWAEDEGVIINGEHYDSWCDASNAYSSKKNFWLRFPYPIIVVIAYLLIGFSFHNWGSSTLLFLTIPLYYMVVNAFIRRRVASIITSLYAIGATIWFLFMGFYEPYIWHPTWMIFLTIPLVSWLAHELFSRRSKREKSA
jgi:HTH-type transcriptional regulator/antitoxin HipB